MSLPGTGRVASEASRVGSSRDLAPALFTPPVAALARGATLPLRGRDKTAPKDKWDQNTKAATAVAVGLATAASMAPASCRAMQS
jgi:hypothetical protein